jgi:hypothetical protein
MFALDAFLREGFTALPESNGNSAMSPGNRANGSAVKKALERVASSKRAEGFQRFFKAGPGDYAEGDQFIGVTVPDQRKIAKQFRDLPREEIDSLLADPIHEYRLTAIFIVVVSLSEARIEKIIKVGSTTSFLVRSTSTIGILLILVHIKSSVPIWSMSAIVVCSMNWLHLQIYGSSAWQLWRTKP